MADRSTHFSVIRRKSGISVMLTEKVGDVGQELENHQPLTSDDLHNIITRLGDRMRLCPNGSA